MDSKFDVLNIWPVDVINRAAKTFEFSSYLEIGVRRPHENFDKIEIPVKHGVDINPESGATFTMTSDEFFEDGLDNGLGLARYDCIYVDGDHRFLPAMRDMGHAVSRLTLTGMVFCHDVWPTCPHPEWDLWAPGYCGEAWKAFAMLQMSRPDLWIATLKVRFGLGVIIPGGGHTLFIPDETPYLAFEEDSPVDRAFYLRYEERLMNLMSVEEFFAIFD